MMNNELQDLKQNMILRDYLAIDRTKMANQRTFLSFLRTSLYLVVTAVAVIKLEPLQDLLFMAWILLAGGAAFLVAGIISYFGVKKKIRGYYKQQEQYKVS